MTPADQHDSRRGNASAAAGCQRLEKGECDLIPGKPRRIFRLSVPGDLRAFHLDRPAAGSHRQRREGIARNTQSEMDLLRKAQLHQGGRPGEGQPKLETAIDAAEMILALAPETNGPGGGSVASAERDHRSRAYAPRAEQRRREDRFRDIPAQPRKIISAQARRSGLEDEHVSITPVAFD
ncbi:hypothetical protein MJ561_17815 [Klebsiella pneumoniae]|nr:hypothetical protein MJ561_17815 [Klebsiella pneumoniae]